MPAGTHTLSLPKPILRVHEDSAREICLLWSADRPVWGPTATMPSVWSNLEYSAQEARPSAAPRPRGPGGASALWAAHAARPCLAVWADTARAQLPLPPSPATYGGPVQGRALAHRQSDLVGGWAVGAVPRAALGAVSDGVETLSRASRDLSGPCAVPWTGTHQDLAATH